MNHDQSDTTPSSKAVFGFLLFVCRSLAVSVEAFLHRSGSFGERYMGLHAAAVLLVAPFYTLFWPGHDLIPLLVFVAAFLLMCFVIRVRTLVRRRRGNPQPHSYYSGTPRLMRFAGRISERTMKAFVQPVLAFVSGALVMPLSEVLGGYLMVASLGMVVSSHLSIGIQRERAMDMHDAAIEASSAAEELRSLRGESVL